VNQPVPPEHDRQEHDHLATARQAATELRRQRSARSVPRATYRLQLTPDFTFADAAAIVPQLAMLGVSHLYLSPILQAVPSSTHGYDVIDPSRIRAEFGGPDGLAHLANTVRDAGLGMILDIVPNHVGLHSPANPWWWETLRDGPTGRYGRHLDIRWTDGRHGQPTVLVPQLGAPLDDELEGDDLHLAHATTEEAPGRAGFRISYHEHAWPVRPGSLEAVELDPDDVPATLERVRADRHRLRALLEQQHYRLAFWRRANEELNYRRFFDVATLGAVRVEDPAVFADAHQAVLPRLHDGTFDGLRIDHPDGLRDPVGYLRELRDATGPDAWIVVEKVLERGEQRRTDWPIDGTVGYGVADLILGAHVDPAAGPVLDELQAELTGTPIDRDAMTDAAKRTALTTLFGAERAWLTDELVAACPDLDPTTAHDALVELLVAWPVYRTYVRPTDDAVSATDRRIIDDAVATAATARTDLADTIGRVRALLLLEDRPDGADRFILTFQQLTGPAIAKGLEDTVLYRDLRFVAVNEVGGHPGELGRTAEEFHADSERRQQDWPATMILSSTHDTKRSHDVRARLATLSQAPQEWADLVRRWHELTRRHRGHSGPSPAHEHLVFQTLVGTWPITEDRLTGYLVKAAREGKERTDWLETDTAYESDLTAFASALLADERFLTDLTGFVDQIREPGWLTSLSMQLVALTTPGVPDLYQGSEVWDLSLVDPDNRRPVDHGLRARLLAELTDQAPDPAALLSRLDEGLPKLWMIRQALACRRSHPQAFGPDAGYRPLRAAGMRADHLLAYARDEAVMTLAPLRVRGLGDTFAGWDWVDTHLEVPSGDWLDVLTGEQVSGGLHPVARLLDRFPVGLLVRR
jgi:(1->4)-alpha-D-glucan 1-alpha-D-glucosylmutase